MKNLLVNRDTYPLLFKKCKNLGEVISFIEKQGENENLYITNIYLNEEPMNEEEESLLDSLSISEIEQLNFNLSSMEEMTRQSIIELISALQVARLKAEEFFNKFQNKKKWSEEDFSLLLFQCRLIMDGLEHIFQAHSQGRVSICQALLWEEAEEKLSQTLESLLKAHQAESFERASHLIENDLRQAFEVWEETLEKEIVENSSLNGSFSGENRRKIIEL